MMRSLKMTGLLVAAATVGSVTTGLWVVAVAAAAGSASADINLTKTVTGVSPRPVLGLTLAADRMRSVPGDTITYTATVSNAGSALTVTGAVKAANGNRAPATVAAVWDEIEYKDLTTKTWVPLGGFADSTRGYAFLVAPPATTGMALTATGSPSAGVQYGTDGGMVGSVLQPGVTATWSYSAVLSLTATQVQTLGSSAAVGGIRNVIHFEVTPRLASDGQPFTYRAAFDNPYVNSSGVVTGVRVTIAPPAGAPASFDSSTTPPLGLLSPGASVAVKTQYHLPVLPAKGAEEGDADYVARLLLRDGAALDATAEATAGDAVAPPTAHATVTETLPIGSVAKSGPDLVDAGSTATYQIHVANIGSATAINLDLVDMTPDGSSTQVPGVPADLAAGGSMTMSADYAVPANQPEGPITDTARFTWHDANGNEYGPLRSSFTTMVSTPPARPSN